MDKSAEFTEQWAIVELMGHKLVAGQVSKSELFGKPLLRIDIPENELAVKGTRPAFTQFYGLDSIYCITPVSEEVARATSRYNDPKPIGILLPPGPVEMVGETGVSYRTCKTCGREWIDTGDICCPFCNSPITERKSEEAADED